MWGFRVFLPNVGHKSRPRPGQVELKAGGGALEVANEDDYYELSCTMYMSTHPLVRPAPRLQLGLVCTLSTNGECADVGG
jgi:hypothetical protein